jgi:hypothetical protein
LLLLAICGCACWVYPFFQTENIFDTIFTCLKIVEWWWQVADYFYVQKNGYISKRAFGAHSKQIFAFARR